jgi:predicted kinase
MEFTQAGKNSWVQSDVLKAEFLSLNNSRQNHSQIHVPERACHPADLNTI